MCRLIKFSNDASQQITTLLYIKRACELNKSHIISTDEDPGLRIESFAVINLRGVSTNKTIVQNRIEKTPALLNLDISIIQPAKHNY